MNFIIHQWVDIQEYCTYIKEFHQISFGLGWREIFETTSSNVTFVNGINMTQWCRLDYCNHYQFWREFRKISQWISLTDCQILMGFPQYWLGLSKFIRIPNPPKEPTRSNPKPTDPTTSAGRRRVFITRNQFRRVRLRFSSLKTWKTQTDRKISKFWLKNPNSGQNFPEFGDKT